MKIFLLLSGTALYLNSEIALAAENCSKGFSFEIWVALIWAFLKPASWLLGVISEKTETKWDNRLALNVSKAVSYFGWLVGVFGIGNVPGSVKHRPKLKKLPK